MDAYSQGTDQVKASAYSTKREGEVMKAYCKGLINNHSLFCVLDYTHDPHMVEALTAKQAIDKMRTTQAIALIDLAHDLLTLCDGDVAEALAYVAAAPLSDADRDVVSYWIDASKTEAI